MAVACGDGTRLKVANAAPRLPGSHPPPSARQRQSREGGTIGNGYGQSEGTKIVTRDELRQVGDNFSHIMQRSCLRERERERGLKW